MARPQAQRLSLLSPVVPGSLRSPAPPPSGSFHRGICVPGRLPGEEVAPRPLASGGGGLPGAVLLFSQGRFTVWRRAGRWKPGAQTQSLLPRAHCRWLEKEKPGWGTLLGLLQGMVCLGDCRAHRGLCGPVSLPTCSAAAPCFISVPSVLMRGGPPACLLSTLQTGHSRASGWE